MNQKSTASLLFPLAGSAWLSVALLSAPALSQIVVPTTVNGPVAGFSNATSNYVLNNSITCPTPTINVTGFGGDTDGSSTDRNDIFRRQSADVSAWGVAVGISFPLSGASLRDFCKKFAAAQSDFQQTRARNQAQNSRLALLQQCLYIQDSLGIRISKNPDFFNSNGALSAFSDCLTLSSVLDAANRRPVINPTPLSPAPIAPTDSASPGATPVTLTQ